MSLSMASAGPHHDRFVVTIVCTANVCRSPALAALLRQEIARTSCRDKITVLDAGTHVSEGEAVCPEIVHRAGIQVAARAHRARPVTAQLIQRSNLILAASAHERRSIAQLDPRARERTFTVLEAISLDARSRTLDFPTSGRRVTPESRIVQYPARLHTARSHAATTGHLLDPDIPDAHTSRTRHAEIAQHVVTAAAQLSRSLARAATRP